MDIDESIEGDLLHRCYMASVSCNGICFSLFFRRVLEPDSVREGGSCLLVAIRFFGGALLVRGGDLFVLPALRRFLATGLMLSEPVLFSLWTFDCERFRLSSFGAWFSTGCCVTSSGVSWVDFLL